MASTTKVAKLAAMRRGIEVLVTISATGSAISARIPILVDVEEEKGGG